MNTNKQNNYHQKTSRENLLFLTRPVYCNLFVVRQRKFFCRKKVKQRRFFFKNYKFPVTRKLKLEANALKYTLLEFFAVIFKIPFWWEKLLTILADSTRRPFSCGTSFNIEVANCQKKTSRD